MNVLINYATPNLEPYRGLSSATAKLLGGFDQVIEYTASDLDPCFRAQHAQILSHSRGAGYWLWKPYIVLKSLMALGRADVLFYLDADFLFSGSAKPLIQTMLDAGHDLTAFEARGIERFSTKRDCFVLMDSDDPRFTDTPQVESGYSLWRKSAFSLDFAREWLRHAEDERLVTDTPNVCGEENYEGFQDHRHDQSIFSLLCKSQGVPLHRQPWREPNPDYPLSTYPAFLVRDTDRPAALWRYLTDHRYRPRLSGATLLALGQVYRSKAVRRIQRTMAKHHGS